MKLVLLPGMACDHRMWHAQLEALAPMRPVVSDVHFRYDTIEAMAAALLTEHEGELALCGASMGGMVAMEASRQAPGRVARLAILGTNARPETEEMRRVRMTAIALFRQGKMREVVEPNIALAFHPEHAGNVELRGRYLQMMLDAGADALERQNRVVIARPDARLHLASVRARTLVLCGDADQLTPPDCSREIASLVPDAEFGIIERCGHMLTMEQPQPVSARLLAFLS